MIKRVVKLTIRKEAVNAFFQIFSESKDKILSQQGCHYVEMLQDSNDPRLCFTYSLWDNQASLDRYRKSELFGKVWPETKKLMEEKPEAWSMVSKDHTAYEKD